MESVMEQSFKSLMYDFSDLKSKEKTVAKSVFEKCNTFHEEQPEEILEEMKAGAVLRWSEEHPPVGYTAEWRPCGKGEKPAFIATAEWALSYSTQKTNGLKESDPLMHKVLRSVQIPVNKYWNANKNALIAKVKEVHDEVNGITRQRAPTADFAVTLKQTLESLKTRCKNANGRGDETADLKKLDRCIAVFNKEWTK